MFYKVVIYLFQFSETAGETILKIDQGERLFGTTCCISHYKHWVLNWVAHQNG